jgi:hypothetical protein
VSHGDGLAAAEREARAEAELVAGGHGEGADGQLGAVRGLQEDGHALASLGLQPQRGLADDDVVAILGGELLGLLN